MKASVVIVTYNRGDIIEKCLIAIEQQTVKPYQVIVVDSSNNKKTRSVVSKFKKVKYTHTNKKIYQPAARNYALKRCKGDVIAFIDDDALADRRWLEFILKGYMNNAVAGVTGPSITADKNLKILEKITRTRINQNRVMPSGDILSASRRWIPPNPVMCDVMLGANMSFLRKHLSSVGGFDEYYGKHAAFREETDPQIALLRKGFRFMYVPQALVWHIKHQKGGIRSNPSDEYYYWCGINHRYLVDKYRYSKFLSRLSWLTFSMNPPSLPLGILLSIVRRDKNILGWYRGLFKK